MADYYPLLERAVAGLRDSTTDSRRAIYDRARSALVGQLRNMDPPVPEADIERETAALDDAVRRLEDKLAPPPAEPAEVRPEPPVVPQRRPLPPGSPTARVPPVVPPPARERPPAPAPGRERLPLAPRPASPPRERPSFAATSRLAAAPGSRTAAALRVEAPAESVSEAPAARRPGLGAPKIGVVGRAEEPAGPSPGVLPAMAPILPVAPNLPVAPGLQVPSFSAALDAAEAAAAADEGAADEGAAEARSAASPPTMRGREEALRPFVPDRSVPEARGIGFWVVAGVALVLMVVIGLAAWTLRDRPDQIKAAKAAPPVIEAPGKISGRVDGAVAAASQSQPAAESNAGGAAVPAPIPLGQNEEAAAPVPGGSNDQQPAAPAIAVSQRAALLVEAPEDAQKVRTYVGSVIWNTQSISPGQGQPLATAVKAEVDIPDVKLKMTMTIQKNTEPQLPASHTMEFKFMLQPGSPLGGIKQINVPEMRKDDEAQTGTMMTGVTVSIQDNYFLVGLSGGAAEATNLRLMQDRNWFDVTILLASGKVGKVTFEKGATGERVIDDAFKAWQ